MSKKKEFYLGIRQHLEAIPSVKHVRLFNNQFNKIAEEVAFPFPCVFLEFVEGEYYTIGSGLQKGDVVARLHVGFDSIKDEDLAILDLLQEIHEKIQGLSINASFTGLNRAREAQDTDHDVVSVWLLDYAYQVTDDTTSREKRLVLAQIDEIELKRKSAKPFLTQE